MARVRVTHDTELARVPEYTVLCQQEHMESWRRQQQQQSGAPGDDTAHQSLSLSPRPRSLACSPARPLACSLCHLASIPADGSRHRFVRAVPEEGVLLPVTLQVIRLAVDLLLAKVVCHRSACFGAAQLPVLHLHVLMGV